VPEGDTLHRAARRLQPLVGQRVEAESPHPRAQAERVARRLDGRMLESVEAKGQLWGNDGCRDRIDVRLDAGDYTLLVAGGAATAVPGVYAAGDVAGYEGKITLITIGMGEAAIAANNAIARIRGEKVQPKYSTD